MTTNQEAMMTETPGTDRDEAREKIEREIPTTPDGVEHTDSDPAETADGGTGDQAKPPAGDTDLI